MNTEESGHSLLELLVVLGLGAMLTVLATSGYAAVLQRANRHEVRMALWRLAAAQENHRLRFGRYAVSIATSAAAASSSDTLATQPFPAGWQFGFQSISEAGWVVVATAGESARDRECLEWRLDQSGTVAARAADGRDTTTRCWRQ